MAGAQDSDNPVAINVTALVDIIFCLIIFFMCSFHFKQLEGKIDTWLDAPGGLKPQVEPVILQEIRVFMRWDAAAGAVVRRVGNRPALTGDAELMRAVRGMRDDYRRAGIPDRPVILDATPEVPWTDVVHVVDLCKRDGVDQIQFAAPLAKMDR